MRISDWSSDVCSSDLISRKGAVKPLGYIRQRIECNANSCGCPDCRGIRGEPVIRCVHQNCIADCGPRKICRYSKLREVRVPINVSPNILITYRSEEHTSELQSLMRI